MNERELLTCAAVLCALPQRPAGDEKSVDAGNFKHTNVIPKYIYHPSTISKLTLENRSGELQSAIRTLS